jgi:hypothetical protein
MESTGKAKKAINELASNLGTNTDFMVGELRAFFRKSAAISEEASEAASPLKTQFDEAVDQAGKVMMQTGKLSEEDIRRAADRLKDSYELFLQEKDQEWDDFVQEIGKELQAAGQVDQETFQKSVAQAKKTMLEHLVAAQGYGEEHKQMIEAYTADMSTKAAGMWELLKSNLEEGGQKIDRAVEAAARELKK